MSKLESILETSRKRKSSVKELGENERSEQVRRDCQLGRERESEINAHRISKEDAENFIRIAKIDCKKKKGNHHFKILDDTATQEYWIERGRCLWEEQLQDVVVETQMKRDSARSAESEKVLSLGSGSRIFRKDEKEKSKIFWKEVAADSIQRLKIAAKPES